jgi:threonine aldolase
MLISPLELPPASPPTGSVSDAVDLRSDTVTRPSPRMRQAMAEAEVGDDVYGEDPTAKRLEERAAAIAGKEAALFVPSGSMGNQIAIVAQTERGQEIVAEARSHVMDWELSMVGWLAGCTIRTVQSESGLMSWAQIRQALRPASPLASSTGLVCIENTHNLAGGRVYPLEGLQEIRDGCREAGIPVHLDGARVFNAACASGRTVAEIAACADSVMFCLSKGLGAPVGSMLAGTGAFVGRARVMRKRLGGGMRQVGVLAAAGLVALEEGPALLAADHARARLLAEAAGRVPGLKVALDCVETNIVMVEVLDADWNAAEVARRLRERGVLVHAFGERWLRMVTHRDVTDDGCHRAIEVFRQLETGMRSAVAGAGRVSD